MELNFFGLPDETLINDFMNSIGKSKYKDFLVLKGARNLNFYLQKHTGKPLSRMTLDVDLQAISESVWEEFKKDEKYLSSFSELNLQYEIIETRHNRIFIAFKGQSFKLQVDMNISVEWDQFEPQGDSPLKGYPLGFMLADKIKVFVSPKVCRRVKDMYDLYVISSSLNIKLSEIRDEMLIKMPSIPEITPHDINSLRHAYDRFHILTVKPKFEDIFDQVSLFSYPLIDCVYDSGIKEAYWDKDVGGWNV